MDKFEEIEEIKKFKLSGERIAQELAKTLNLPYYDLQVVKPEVDALKYVSQDVAEKTKAIPLKKIRDQILIAVVDPYNPDFLKLKDSLEKQGLKVNLAIISPESFEIGKEEYKFLTQKRISYTKVFETNIEAFNEIEKKVQKKEDLQDLIQSYVKNNPFIILDFLIGGALKFNASDIHFEPTEDKVLIRYRLDGILYDVSTFPKNIYPLLKNRIKVLAGMMINIKDKPQDGSFSVVFHDQKFDLRVSVVPSAYDEAIVFRILNIAQIQVPLEALGFRPDDLEIILKMIHMPNGLILNTGPTGSGKTTTLYAILLRIKSPKIKIITIEDPIEYRIEGISQTQVDPARGYTFASALRAFLRHDPDVVLVGEIRDKETAEIAAQASLTGHLVLSTLHTNDSLGAIPRFISLEVDPKLIASALRLVIAQRLVRKVCPYCQKEYSPDENLKNRIKEKLKNLPTRVKLNFDLENFTLVKGQGCEKCFQTGYKGRIAIFELLEITKDLEELIYQKPSERQIFDKVKDNFVSLQQDALIKALEKITTLEEVERVTGLI